MSEKSRQLAEGGPAQVEKRRDSSTFSLRPPLLEALVGEKSDKRLVLSPLELALYRLTCTINARTTPIQDAVKSLMSELNAEEASIHLVGRSKFDFLEHYLTISRAGGELTFSSAGEEAGYMSAAAFKDNSMFYSVPRRARRSNKMSVLFRFNMIPGDMEYSTRDIKNGDKHVCAVPLFMAEDVSSKRLGVLTLKGKMLGVQDDKRAGEAAVQKAAILVACGARLISRVVDARFDTLTGLQKRAEFEAQLGTLVRDYLSGGPNFSVLMFDLDHFKDVNDQYGHDAGDLALREVASTLSGGLRAIRRSDILERRADWRGSEVDQLFRWGGEELVALLPRTGTSEAVLIADRLRLGIESTPVDAEGTQIRLSVSTGVSDADSVIGRKDRHDTEEENLAHKLTRESDFALYTAKKCGRNLVAFADGSPEAQHRYVVHKRADA